MWKRGWKRLVLWFFLGKWQKILSCCARVLESRNRLIENDWWTLNIGMPSSIPSCPPHELNSLVPAECCVRVQFESIDPLPRRTFQANHCQFPLDNARGGGRVAHVSLHLQVAPRHVLKFVI
ncbi:hypothetical protein D6D00_00821 [Aureobasidium pullulans]|nr:hypothetical protein D6D00_00821 [Aureobasidium pullulans]